MFIESTKNETVKRTRSLTAKKCRVETGLHFIEGEKLVREALLSGAEIIDCFIEDGFFEPLTQLENSGARIYTVTRRVMEALTNTNEPQHICATVKTPVCEIPAGYPEGLIVITDNVQDPGNMGTIIRTADAFGAVGVLLDSGCADPFSPKVVRASMGSVYHIPIWFADIKRALSDLKAQGFILVCGHLEGKEKMPDIIGKRVGVVIGNEGRGVCEEAAQMCIKYRLPMYGRAESLNASVAAGILIYEFANRIRSN